MVPQLGLKDLLQLLCRQNVSFLSGNPRLTSWSVKICAIASVIFREVDNTGDIPRILKMRRLR